MKRFIAVLGGFILLVCSTSFGQELSIGPIGGALFTQGSHGHAGGMNGTSFSIGGEVVYSFASIPLDLVGQASYSPMEGHYYRRDSLGATPGHERHGGGEGSLFSLGLGGRWVPLRGSVSPYLGLSVLISHQDGSGHRPDSTEAYGVPVGNPPPPDHPGYYEGGGGITRFGVGVSVGSEFVLSSFLRLDVGASYSMNSPFERGSNLSTIGFGASLLFTLF